MVRTGLTIDFVAIGRNLHPSTLQMPGDFSSLGCCQGVAGEQQKWIDTLPSADAVDYLHRSAAVAAAGVVADRPAGLDGHRHDLLQIFSLAEWLGVAKGPNDPAMLGFVNTAIVRAGGYLQSDRGVAWERVTTKLLARRRLSGDDVRAIVAEVDGR